MPCLIVKDVKMKAILITTLFGKSTKFNIQILFMINIKLYKNYENNKSNKNMNVYVFLGMLLQLPGRKKKKKKKKKKKRGKKIRDFSHSNHKFFLLSQRKKATVMSKYAYLSAHFESFLFGRWWREDALLVTPIVNRSSLKGFTEPPSSSSHRHHPSPYESN